MNNIAALRKEKNMTQAELATLLGVSQGTLSQYESGKRTPDSKVLLRLVGVFQKTANYILGIPEEKTLQLDNSTLSMTQVTAIRELNDYLYVNVCLRAGWRLVHIGTRSHCGDMGTESFPSYIIGWFGNPDDAILPENPYEPTWEQF